jgi:hypothetical protein
VDDGKICTGQNQERAIFRRVERNGARLVMSYKGRPIFRVEALRRNAQVREKSVLLRLSSPRALALLWILIGLLMMSGLLIWYVRVPVYVSGVAIVTGAMEPTPNGGGKIKVVAFLPPEDLARLRVGQKLFLSSEKGGERRLQLVTGLEPDVLSPLEMQNRFGFSACQSFPAGTHPNAVVFTELMLASAGPDASSYTCSFYHADVEVGTQRVISLLPVIGHLLG